MRRIRDSRNATLPDPLCERPRWYALSGAVRLSLLAATQLRWRLVARVNASPFTDAPRAHPAFRLAGADGAAAYLTASRGRLHRDGHGDYLSAQGDCCPMP